MGESGMVTSSPLRMSVAHVIAPGVAKATMPTINDLVVRKL
jgi:hypothetical protein